MGAERDTALQPEAPREPWVGCRALLRFPRTMGCSDVQRRLGYPVRPLDKGGNVHPQSKSRIRSEARHRLPSKPGLFHASVIFRLLHLSWGSAEVLELPPLYSSCHLLLNERVIRTAPRNSAIGKNKGSFKGHCFFLPGHPRPKPTPTLHPLRQASDIPSWPPPTHQHRPPLKRKAEGSPRPGLQHPFSEPSVNTQ